MKPGRLLTVLCFAPIVAWAAPLTFDTFSHLYVGMREADLLRQAGRPDYMADGGGADLPSDKRVSAGSAAVRQYVWKADPETPYTTIISVSGGLVVSIQRESNF